MSAVNEPSNSAEFEDISIPYYLLKLRDLILQNGFNCLLSSAHAELQLAIDYSRLMKYLFSSVSLI